MAHSVSCSLVDQEGLGVAHEEGVLLGKGIGQINGSRSFISGLHVRQDEQYPKRRRSLEPRIDQGAQAGDGVGEPRIVGERRGTSSMRSVRSLYFNTLRARLPATARTLTG